MTTKTNNSATDLLVRELISAVTSGPQRFEEGYLLKFDETEAQASISMEVCVGEEEVFSAEYIIRKGEAPSTHASCYWEVDPHKSADYIYESGVSAQDCPLFSFIRSVNWGWEQFKRSHPEVGR